MRNKRLYNIGSAAALVSMASMSFLVPLQRNLQAAQDEMVGQDPYAETLASIKLFWNQVWEQDLANGELGMVLTEETEHDVWNVKVANGATGTFVAEGRFEQVLRIHLPQLSPTQAELQEAGLESLEHYAVSGLVTGPGGEQNLTAMVTEIGFSGATGNLQGAPTIVCLIEPLQMAGDSASAVMAALDFEAMVDYVAQWGYWACVGQVILCEVYTAACFVGAPVCYAGCVALCTGAGPGYLICMVACIIACTGGTLAICATALACWQTACAQGCVPDYLCP